MRKIFPFICFTILVAFLPITNTVQAQTRIGIIVKTDNITLSPEIQNQLSDSMNNLFPQKQYQLLKNKDLDSDFDSLIASRLIKDPADYTKIELLELCEKYNYDAILLLYYRFETSSSNYNFLKLKSQVIVTLKTRMVYVNTKNYIYQNDITRVGINPITKAKDISNLSPATLDAVSKCNEQLFSILELPMTKRTFELS